MSIQLGNMAITSGTDTYFSGAPHEGVKAILIGNESGLTVTITMEGGSVQKTLYPSTLDWFTVNPGFNGNIKIHPTSILTNASTFPGSSLIFDAIGLNDSEQASMYPLSLVRNTNIGNTVATTGGSTTSVTNDNQALGTQFIESTPTGAAGSTVAISNDGTVTIKGDVANVLTTLLQLLPSAGAGASSVKLGDSARVVESLGNLLVDGKVTATSQFPGFYISTNNADYRVASSGGGSDGALNYDGSNNWNIVPKAGGNVTLKDSGATSIATFTTTAATLPGTLSIAGTHTTVTGNTHGTADVYEVLVGNLKALLVTFTAFANNGGDQDLVLGTAYTARTWFYGSDSANMGFKDTNGVKQNTGILTTLGTGAAAGATTTETTILQNSFGASNTGFTKLSFLGAAGVTQRNGMFLVFGQ